MGEHRGTFFAGIDCGSSFCKGALLYTESPRDDAHIAALACRPTGWNVAETGRLIMEELAAALPMASLPMAAFLSAAKVPENLQTERVTGKSAESLPVTLAATGYGREKIAGALTVTLAATGYGREKIAGAAATLTEISAHARGAAFLVPGVRTVIDIGGQDCKVIAVEEGRVRDFQMNDKCAAGSGRFLEMVERRLELDTAAMEELLALEKEVPLNSTCVVFAESEIIGLLANGASREEILGGAVASLSRRIAVLAGKIGVFSPVILTGGLSESVGIRTALSRILGAELQPVPHGIYAGAIGAALSSMP
jgi:predicted CoA-substrate-specific enzyme activase